MIGVVKHEVNMSAGRSGLVGRISFAPQAPKRIKSLAGFWPTAVFLDA